MLLIVRITEAESRTIVARSRLGENGTYLMGTEFQFYKMKIVLGMDGGEGSTL